MRPRRYRAILIQKDKTPDYVAASLHVFWLVELNLFICSRLAEVFRSCKNTPATLEPHVLVLLHTSRSNQYWYTGTATSFILSSIVMNRDYVLRGTGTQVLWCFGTWYRSDFYYAYAQQRRFNIMYKHERWAYMLAYSWFIHVFLSWAEQCLHSPM